MVVGAQAAVEGDGVTGQLDDLGGARERPDKARSAPLLTPAGSPGSHLVGAGVGHGPVVLGLVDADGGLCGAGCSV